MKKLIDFEGKAIYGILPNGNMVLLGKAETEEEFLQLVMAQLMAGEDSAGFSDRAVGKLIMPNRVHDGIRIFSRWGLKHFRDGKLIHEERGIPNLYVTEGITHILNLIFKNGTKIDPWYVGIQQTNNPAAGWTMANQGTTWDQFTSVDESVWPEAVDGSISAGQIAMSQVTFNINASGTVYGAHLTSNSTKGATTGTLICAVNFSASRAVQSGDDLLVTYTVGASDDGV